MKVDREYVCLYWKCNARVQPNHFLCGFHFNNLLDGFLDVCPACRRFKHVDWRLCGDCERGRPVTGPGLSTVDANKYKVEHSEAWKKHDVVAKRFYVYILRLNNGQFYAGQSRELRERLEEHREGKVKSTVGRAPKLNYFEVLPTREAAELREAQLKELIDSNPREIRRLILSFRDNIKELDF